MQKHPFWTRFLSLALGLALLLSGFSAIAAGAGGTQNDLSSPDSAWDHFPSTEGLDTAKLQTYTSSGNWAFAQAPTGTTSFAELTDLYYIPNYDTWAVSAGIDAAGSRGVKGEVSAEETQYKCVSSLRSVFILRRPAAKS